MGRFLSVDPLYKKNISVSPFQFGGNSPISYIDDGGDNILYIVFLRGENPLLTQSHKDEIIKTAQSVYTDQGINVRVVQLEVDRAFTEAERSLFDGTDRMTYVAQKKESLHKIDPVRTKDGGEPFNSEGYTYGDGTGFYSYDNFINNDMNPIMEGLSNADLEEAGENLIGPKNMDLVSWIARNAIHEGGGHGTISGKAVHFPSGQAADHDKPSNIMQAGRYTPFYQLPMKQDPALFLFTSEHAQLLREYFNRPADYQLVVTSPDGRTEKTEPILVEPKDNFSERIKKQ